MGNRYLLFVFFILQPFIILSQTDTSNTDKYFVHNDSVVLSVQKIVLYCQDIDTIGIDTMQRHSELFDGYETRNLPYINLGQKGTPEIPLVFFHRKSYDNFFFLEPYSDFFEPIGKVFYYKTNRPYTKFKYFGGAKTTEEQYLSAIHTQTPNPNTNWGLSYDMHTAMDLSHYPNANSMGLLNVWVHKQIKRYSFLFLVSNFSIKRSENGGIIDTSQKFSPYDQNNLYFLSGVRSYMKGLSLKFYNLYKLTDNLSLFGNIELSKKSRVFKEDDVHQSYFGSTLITNKLSYDSVGFRSNDLQLGVDFLYGKLKTAVAFNVSLQRAYYFRGFLYNLNGEFLSDHYFSLRSKFRFWKLKNSIYSEYHLTGRYTGDWQFVYDFSVKPFKIDFFKLRGIIDAQRKAVGFFYDNYNGNYYRWNNFFQPVRRASATLWADIKFLNTQVGINYYLTDNYVYFDTLSLPQQDTAVFNVKTAWIKTTVRLNPLVVDLQAYYQLPSDNDILHLPQYVASASVYFDFGLAHNALHLNTGADVYYFSQFNTFKYNPALGVFYLANDRITGNYPVINFFLTGKIKSAVVLLRFDNALGWLLAPYHETVEHYHIPDFYYRLGVQWWFKN